MKDDDLSYNKPDTQLCDTYLPALRTFRTTLRATKKSNQAQVVEFKRQQQLEALKPIVPKLINREKINVSRTESLFERQHNILIQAQMQCPVKKPSGKDGDKGTFKRTRFKDWLMEEVQRKVKEKETEAIPEQKLKAMDREDQKCGAGDGDESDDVYDPLVDSDGSSERSETPPRLTGAEIQEIIKCKSLFLRPTRSRACSPTAICSLK